MTCSDFSYSLGATCQNFIALVSSALSYLFYLSYLWPACPRPPLPPPPPVIGLFTDYGWDDPYVAQLKGVIITINPNARLLDITHSVSPFNVTEGSYLLDQCAEEFPAGTIFVAVVDPQVGTDRDPVLLQTGKGKFFVGPDNGLFSAVIQHEGLAKAWKLDRPQFFRAGAVSKTFHGRDIFGPVAAHLAGGTDPERLGTEVKSLNLLPDHEPSSSGGMISLEVQHIDHYGNVIMNLAANNDLAAKLKEGNVVKIEIGREKFLCAYGQNLRRRRKGAAPSGLWLRRFAGNQHEPGLGGPATKGGTRRNCLSKTMNAYFFKPIYQERIWGDQNLSKLFGRTLPADKKIGESWELVDRPEACSEIESGPGLAPGTRQSIHTLWQDKRKEIFGTRAPDLAPLFPS